MLTSAFAESTRPPRPGAAAYPGPDDERLLPLEATGRCGWRESSKRSSSSVGAGPPFRWHCDSALRAASDRLGGANAITGPVPIGVIATSPMHSCAVRSVGHESDRLDGGCGPSSASPSARARDAEVVEAHPDRDRVGGEDLADDHVRELSGRALPKRFTSPSRRVAQEKPCDSGSLARRTTILACTLGATCTSGAVRGGWLTRRRACPTP